MTTSLSVAPCPLVVTVSPPARTTEAAGRIARRRPANRTSRFAFRNEDRRRPDACRPASCRPDRSHIRARSRAATSSYRSTGCGRFLSRNEPLMLDFDVGQLRRDQRVGNLPGAQDLAAGGLRGDPRRDIHRRTEMDVAPQQRSAMVQAGANHREMPAIGDRHGRVATAHRSQPAGRETPETRSRQSATAIARGFDRSPDQCAELVQQIRRGVLAMGVGQRRVAGDVDEAEGRFDGSSVPDRALHRSASVSAIQVHRLRQRLLTWRVCDLAIHPPAAPR